MFTPAFTAQAVIAAATRAQAEKSQYQLFTDDSPFQADGYVTIQHKGEPSRRYLVILPGASMAHPEGKCNCPAWSKANGVCKHVYIALETLKEEEAAAEEVMLEELYEREEAKEFMLETSREHAVGFTAEVYDDVAGAFPA
jgi:hypothetical protein